MQAARAAERILDVTERLVQSHGYNGFSYADVAAELNVSKPGLHYHFPGKAELAQALVTCYATSLALGNRFMAPRTGFTAKTQRQKLFAAGFVDLAVEQRAREFALSPTAGKPDQEYAVRCVAWLVAVAIHLPSQ